MMIKKHRTETSRIVVNVFVSVDLVAYSLICDVTLCLNLYMAHMTTCGDAKGQLNEAGLTAETTPVRGP